MKRTKEFIKRNIAGEIVLVPSGQTAREFNGMVTLTETGEFIWEHIEEGNEGNDFKKCEQGNVFFPAHGTIACLYCGDCLAHWAFATYDGNCKLFNT